jgi:hypothetical protein
MKTVTAMPKSPHPLYEAFCGTLEDHGFEVARGVFGASMTVELANESRSRSSSRPSRPNGGGAYRLPLSVHALHPPEQANHRRPVTERIHGQSRLPQADTHRRESRQAGRGESP